MVNRCATGGGGADKHAVELTRALRDHGHEVRFLSTLDERNVERNGAFVPLTGTDFWRGAPPPRQSLDVAVNALWNRRAAAAMRTLVERLRPDVVHLHDLYPQLSAAPAAVAAELGVPVVQTLHNYELVSASSVDHRGRLVDRSDAPGRVRLLRTLLYLARRAVHVPAVTRWIAVSRFVARTHAEHGIDARVLPNFTVAGDAGFPPFDERGGVLFMGRLTEEKGVRDVLALARRVPRVQVTVAGWGPLEAEVRDAADRLQNLEHAGLLDREALMKRVARSRIVVVPSRWQEPAGLVALEAMAAGTPVVAYASGGLSEYVEDAAAGAVVTPGVEHLAAGVTRLSGDRDAWEAMSRAGRAAVRGIHSPERYVARLVELYEEAAATTAATIRG